MAPVYSSAFAPPTTNEIGAMGAMMPAYFSMTHENCLSVQFNEGTMLKKLQKLRPDKSQGPDDIHPMFLLRSAEEVVKPLMILFKASYSAGVLPADWKCANISPIGNRLQ